MPVAARSPHSIRRTAAPAGARGLVDADHVRLRMLIGLCHRRWSLPILAELQREVRPGGGGGAKFVTLANRLHLSRHTLRDTLDDLIERDYLMRNPGVGHPMRPEYMLSESGHDAAPHAAAIMQRLRAARLDDLMLRKWSLPALYAIGRGVSRFSQIKTALPGVTSRALTLALKDLESASLIRRTVTGGYPPGVAYAPAKRSLRIVHALRRIE